MVDQLLGGLFGAQDDDDDDMRRGGPRLLRPLRARRLRPDGRRRGDSNYRAASSRLSPEEYQVAAAGALRNMNPEQRRELRREMKRRSRDRYDAADDSPEELARAMQRADQDGPGRRGLGWALRSRRRR